MKKIRLLALLLALLMLPLGMLAACDKEKDPTVDPADPVDPNPGDDKTEVTYPDGSKTGYLMFFNFDAATPGDYNSKEENYGSYFTAEEANGVSYLIDKSIAKEKNSFLIRREDSDAISKLEVYVQDVKGIGSSHTVEFDVRVEDGCITDEMSIIGKRVGDLTQTLVKFMPDGIYDADGNLVYEYAEGAKWINFALGIDDANGKYTLYIDGSEITTLSYVTAYKTSATGVIESYTFKGGMEKTDFYFYIDNFGIVNGTKPMCYTDYEGCFDTAEDVWTVFDSTSENAREEYFAKVEELIAKISTTPYVGTGKLPLGDVYAMLRYNTDTKEFAQITYDYSYEKGTTTQYGGVFGNKAFKLDDDNWVYFKATGKLEFVGEINGEDANGNYSIAGSADAPQAVITWGNNNVRYITYNAESGNISVSETQTGAGREFTAEPAATLPFGASTYGFTAANQRIYFTVYEYLGIADLIIEGEDSDELLEEDYTYENGVLTIGDYEFVYAEGQFTYGEKTFGVFDAWELMDCEEYCVKYSGYKTNPEGTTINLGYAVSDFDTKWNYTAWSTIKLNVFVPEDTVNYGYAIYLDCGGAGVANVNSLVKYFNTEDDLEEGWNEIEFYIPNANVNGNITLADFVGNIYIMASGTLDNTGYYNDEDEFYTGKAIDGVALYIKDIKFVEVRKFPMNEPDAGKESCTHEGTLVAVDEIVDGGCFSHKYYILKCTECNATKLDIDKGYTVAPGMHTYQEDATQYTVEPGCTVKGYVYVKCDACDEKIILEEIGMITHDIVKSYDASANTINSTCKLCGKVESTPYVAGLYSGEEKFEMLGLNSTAKEQGVLINADTIGDGTIKAGGNFQISQGSGVYTSVLKPNGLYGIKTEQIGSDGSYFELIPKGDLNTAKKYVFEVSVMLGNPDSETGKYKEHTVNYIYRLGGSGGAHGLNNWKIDESGCFISEMTDLTTGKKLTYQLSTEKYTNIATLVDPYAREISYYMDGYLIGTTQFRAFDYVLEALDEYFLVNLRINLPSNPTDATMYFNDMFYYEADQPLCVLGEGGVEIEHSGDVALDDDGIVEVAGADVRLDMPLYTKTTKYVLELTLKGEFAEGAILTGHKLDEYRFENAYDLITVKNGYVYYLNAIICSVEDLNTEDGVKIALETNDKTGKTVIYVNGTAVPGGAISYPADSSYYGAGSSYVVGYTFKADAAENYTVEGLKMYTGTYETK